MKRLHFLLWILVLGSLTACSHTPEQNAETVRTYLAETILAGFTETSAAMPPTETNTATPSPTITASSTSILLIPTAAMITVAPPASTATQNMIFPDKAEFISASPYPAMFTPGQVFTLTWQIKNIGTSNWSGKYKFFHKDGSQLAQQSTYAIDTVVGPQGTLTISMTAQAPDTAGTYQSTWALANPSGIEFYYVYYGFTVGDTSYVTSLPGYETGTPTITQTSTSELTATPSSLDWMCRDPERSKIQGEGCNNYCSANAASMLANGYNCYQLGELVSP